MEERGLGCSLVFFAKTTPRLNSRLYGRSGEGGLYQLAFQEVFSLQPAWLQGQRPDRLVFLHGSEQNSFPFSAAQPHDGWAHFFSAMMFPLDDEWNSDEIIVRAQRGNGYPHRREAYQTSSKLLPERPCFIIRCSALNQSSRSCPSFLPRCSYSA